MFALLSPSKTMNFDVPVPAGVTQPELLAESERLIPLLRKLSEKDLMQLMEISPKLAKLNRERYQQFKTPFTKENAKPCMLAFQGDVYTGLEAESFDKEDLAFAQKSLRILSGLYGLLRPLDLIQPYRLEMGIDLANSRGKNLYAFWGERITDALNRAKEKLIVNLASQEYAGAVDLKKLHADWLTCVFKEKKGGDYKVVALFAKKARGMMARYIVKERIAKPEDLKNFHLGGYAFMPKLSSEKEFVFAR